MSTHPTTTTAEANAQTAVSVGEVPVENSSGRWTCSCGSTVERYRGQSDISCARCGQWFNAFGQRLRKDWQSNASNWDDEVGDLDGHELAHAHDH